MPTLTSHKNNPFIKILLLGESKSGKTGALASLARAGYNLLIADFDNGLDYLSSELADDPEALERIHYQVFRDRTKLSPSMDVQVVGKAKAFNDAFKALFDGPEDAYIDGLCAKDLGPEWVVVVDSLWSAGSAALYEHMKLQPSKDKRQNYGGAQDAIMGMLRNLTDDEFKAHVIVITHMTLIEMEQGGNAMFPAAIGKAVCEHIPKLFNRMIVAEVSGTGSAAKRVLRTVPTRRIPATSGEVKDRIPAELPVETGLATIFNTIRGKK